jgi:hypothetical protein
MDGDQLTIEAYWGPGHGTSPRWGEPWGEIAIRADGFLGPAGQRGAGDPGLTEP